MTNNFGLKHMPDITFTKFCSLIIMSTTNHTRSSAFDFAKISECCGTCSHQSTPSSAPYAKNQGHSHSPQTHHLADRSANTKPLQTPLSCTFTMVSQTLPWT